MPKANEDHDYTKYNINPFIINQQYADDIVETSRSLSRGLPPKLKLKDLLVNDTTTK